MTAEAATEVGLPELPQTHRVQFFVPLPGYEAQCGHQVFATQHGNSPLMFPWRWQERENHGYCLVCGETYQSYGYEAVRPAVRAELQDALFNTQIPEKLEGCLIAMSTRESHNPEQINNTDRFLTRLLFLIQILQDANEALSRPRRPVAIR